LVSQAGSCGADEEAAEVSEGPATLGARGAWPWTGCAGPGPCSPPGQEAELYSASYEARLKEAEYDPRIGTLVLAEEYAAVRTRLLAILIRDGAGRPRCTRPDMANPDMANPPACVGGSSAILGQLSEVSILVAPSAPVLPSAWSMMHSPSFTHHAPGFVRSRDARVPVRAPQAITL
jgi:hypothetical protein